MRIDAKKRHTADATVARLARAVVSDLDTIAEQLAAPGRSPVADEVIAKELKTSVRSLQRWRAGGEIADFARRVLALLARASQLIDLRALVAGRAALRQDIEWNIQADARAQQRDRLEGELRAQLEAEFAARPAPAPPVAPLPAPESVVFSPAKPSPEEEPREIPATPAPRLARLPPPLRDPIVSHEPRGDGRTAGERNRDELEEQGVLVTTAPSPDRAPAEFRRRRL